MDKNIYERKDEASVVRGGDGGREGVDHALDYKGHLSFGH